MTKAFIDIVGRDFTGPAFGGVNSKMNATLASVRSLTLGFAGIAAAVGVGGAFSTFTAFNRSLSEVSTLTNGTAIEISKLEKAAKSMAIEFGSQPIEQTKAFYQVISAGASTSAEAIEILTAANKLAVGGVTDVETAADGLTSVLNSYGGAAGSAADVSDSLFVAMKAGKTTIEELSQGLGKVSPFAAAIGVSFDELTAATAALTKGGISTKESLTGLRAIMAAIVKPTKEATELAEELGLEFNTAGIEADGFAGFIEKVVESTDGSADKLAQLFGGVEALVPVMALAGQAGEDFSVILGDMATKAGATEDAFTLMAESPGFKVDQLMAAVSAAGITLGAVLSDVLTPAIILATQALSDLFTKADGLAVFADKLFTSDIFLDIVRSSGLLGTILVKRVEQQKAVEASTESLNRLIVDSNSLWSDLAGNVGSSGKVIAELPPILKEVGEGLGGSGGISDEAKNLAAEFSKLEIEAKSLIQAFDPLARRNNELAKFVNLLNSGLIGREVFDRAAIDSIERYMSAIEETGGAIEDLGDDHEGLRDQARSVFGDVDQFAIQAARNVQTAFANILIDPDGNIIKQFVSIAKRAAAEIVSSTVLTSASSAFQGQSLSGGIGSLLSGFGSSAKTQQIADATSATSSILSDIKKDNITATARAESGRGASIRNAAFAGIGASVAGSNRNIQALAAGAAVIPVAGTAIAAGIIATDFLDRKFGDFKLSGFTKTVAKIGRLGDVIGAPGHALAQKAFGVNIPDPATLVLKALFGRGPFKLRRQFLQGEATAEGFEGDVITQLKSKGGLLRSNKNKFLTDSLDRETQLLFNETLQGFAKSTKSFAENLGVSTAFVDNFSQTIALESATKQQLDPEVIQDLFNDIGDTFARGLVPAVDALKRSGESAVDTLGRLSSEFDTFQQILIVTRSSVAEANAQAKAASITDISGLVTAGGGAGFLSSQLSFFADNFFSQAEKLELSTQKIVSGLDALGFQADLTVEDFKSNLRSFGKAGGISQDAFFGLLGLAPEFLNRQNLGGSVLGGGDKFEGEFATKLDFQRNLARVGGFRPIAETKSSSEDPLLIETINMRLQLNKTLAAIEASSEKLADLFQSVSAGGTVLLTEQIP